MKKFLLFLKGYLSLKQIEQVFFGRWETDFKELNFPGPKDSENYGAP